MQIHRSSQSLQPILKQPQHDLDQLKTPTQKKAETEAGISNDKVKRIARQSVDKIYETFRKLVDNTEYNVSMSLGKFSENEQFTFTLKNSGKEIVSIPSDVAVTVAEKAKHSTIGLLMDQRV